MQASLSNCFECTLCHDLLQCPLSHVKTSITYATLVTYEATTFEDMHTKEDGVERRSGYEPLRANISILTKYEYHSVCMCINSCCCLYIIRLWHCLISLQVLLQHRCWCYWCRVCIWRHCMWYWQCLFQQTVCKSFTTHHSYLSSGL